MLQDKCARCGHKRIEHDTADGCITCDEPFGPHCDKFLTEKSYTQSLKEEWHYKSLEAFRLEIEMDDPNYYLIQEQEEREEEEEALEEYRKWHGSTYGRSIRININHPLLGPLNFECLESELVCFGLELDENDKVRLISK